MKHYKGKKLTIKVMGDELVGKSALIRSFVFGEFTDDALHNNLTYESVVPLSQSEGMRVQVKDTPGEVFDADKNREYLPPD